MLRLNINQLKNIRLKLIKHNFSVRNTRLNDTCHIPYTFPFIRTYISLKSFLPRQNSTSQPASTLNKSTNPILSQDNLFHPLSTSPFEDLQHRYKQICVHGSCPVCLSQESGVKNKPKYECPDCGYPTHCSLEHYLQDKEQHKNSGSCLILRQSNEDEHDLRSGR